MGRTDRPNRIEGVRSTTEANNLAQIKSLILIEARATHLMLFIPLKIAQDCEDSLRDLRGVGRVRSVEATKELGVNMEAENWSRQLLI